MLGMSIYELTQELYQSIRETRRYHDTVPKNTSRSSVYKFLLARLALCVSRSLRGKMLFKMRTFKTVKQLRKRHMKLDYIR